MRFISFLTKNLLRRKIRSLLTCFGVAIAVGTTVSLLGISEGLERSTFEGFTRRGYDLVAIEDGPLMQLDSDLDERVVPLIEAIPEVKIVVPGLIELMGFEVKGSTVAVAIQGWVNESISFDDLDVLEGRRLKPDDGRVCMLGTTMAKNLNKNLGDTLDIDGEPFEVIGIFESFVGFENISVIVPLKELQEVSAREGRITGVSAVLHEDAKEIETVEKVCDKIMALTMPDGKPARLVAKPIKREVEEATQMKMTRAMAWLTSVIAIIMGTTSVLNTMIMSVMERIREISILRAIGWRRSRIVKMILGESLLLSFVGALAGVAFAIALMRWLPTLPFATDIITPTISLSVILKGFAMAFLVGLIGAVYPAFRASRLLPIEGLRVE